MSLILDGTNGLSDVDGSAATPAIRGTDTNTGIFFPAADTIAFAEGGTEVARIDSSGNLGIGTATPTFSSGTGVQVKGAAFTNVRVTSASSTGTDFAQDSSGNGYMFNRDNAALIYGTNNTERMRISSGGNLLVGATSESSVGATIYGSATNRGRIILNKDGGDGNLINFLYSSTAVGNITTNGTSTTYATSSDYRLKENIAPMTGALSKVAQLKPCTYNWKATGETGEGFIAHELQAVVPDCVTGEKDEVETYTDEDGNEQTRPVYQGIDTSFLVATLTAAIQEQQAMITSLTARIAALENPPVESVTNERH